MSRLSIVLTIISLVLLYGYAGKTMYDTGVRHGKHLKYMEFFECDSQSFKDKEYKVLSANGPNFLIPEMFRSYVVYHCFLKNGDK